MEQSEKIDQLAIALSKVQSESLLALTDSTNPFFNSKYADLSSVWGVTREPLVKNGLSVAQTLDIAEDGSPIIVTTLMHLSGQWLRGRLKMKPDKPGPQAVGSCITYGRRYSLAAMIGVCPEDDDANSATKNQKTNGKTRPPQQAMTGDATENQINAINKIGSKQNLSEIEVTEIMAWYTGGDSLSKQKASEMITGFEKIFEDFLSSKQ